MLRLVSSNEQAGRKLQMLIYILQYKYMIFLLRCCIIVGSIRLGIESHFLVSVGLESGIL